MKPVMCPNRMGLHEESVSVKLIVVQLNPSHIANELTKTTPHHANHKAPCTITNAQEELDAQGNAKKGSEEGIARQVRDIDQRGKGERTSASSAQLWIVP